MDNMSNKEIKSSDILDVIDIDKINNNDKKKRGRPKKNQQYTNPTSKIFPNGSTLLPTNPTSKKVSNDEICDIEEEEIIVHLPLSKQDIDGFRGCNIDEKIHELSVNSEESSDEKPVDPVTFGKQYALVLKRLKEENDSLKKYLTDITPMYYTEIKSYPINLNIYDKLYPNIMI